MSHDLTQRLLRTRRISLPWGGDPSRGLPPGRLDELLERWTHGFDWGVHERRIQAYPWVSVQTSGGEVRMIDQRPADADAPVVVLLHGWPDSVLRFERVLPLLTDLRVIVPALPGFPFAPPLTEPGMSSNRMADLIAAALAELGCTRYTVSGGDVGSMVGEILAGTYPDRVNALHLTNVAPQHGMTVDIAALPEDAAAYVRQTEQWRRREGGYIAEQSTRPNTLAVALGDSPAGLAAWLVEKLDSWSDQGAFTIDELLTWVTAYWVSGTIGTSFSVYTEPSTLPRRVDTPTVLSTFAHDLRPEPRSYADAFLNIHEHIHHSAGGHFAAWEQPALYVDDLRRAVAIGR